ncbi:unnamed protein product [Caenorhabditis nigoni]
MHILMRYGKHTEIEQHGKILAVNGFWRVLPFIFLNIYCLYYSSILFINLLNLACKRHSKITENLPRKTSKRSESRSQHFEAPQKHQSDMFMSATSTSETMCRASSVDIFTNLTNAETSKSKK